MKDKNSRKDDESIRSLMQASKKEAPENLKYRIMHQIETEAALSREQKAPATASTNPLKSFWSIYGIMYAVIALIVGVSYFFKGEKYLLSTEFLSIILLISFVFTIIWMMTKVEEQYRQKHNKHKRQ